MILKSQKISLSKLQFGGGVGGSSWESSCKFPKILSCGDYNSGGESTEKKR